MTVLGALKRRMTAQLDPFLDPAFYDVFDASPLVVYDVGAAGDVYNPLQLVPCARAPVYGFEPVRRSYEALIQAYADNPFVSVKNVALAESDGTVTINVVGDGRETISSLLPRVGLDVESDAVRVQSSRLDSVPERFGFPPADFIKLDTEGSEALILECGQEMLRQHVLGVLTEISFWRRSTGGAVFSDVDRLLTSSGFVLFDLQINRSHISSIGGKKDKVRTGDALYLRDYTHLVDNMVAASPEQRRAKLLKLVSLCVAWRYLNYALELIEFGRREDIISSDEFLLLSNNFRSTADFAELIPNFPGRSVVAQILDVFSSVLHREAKKGIPTAFNGIGNALVARRRGMPPAQATIYCPIIDDGKSRHIKVIDLDAARS